MERVMVAVRCGELLNTKSMVLSLKWRPVYHGDRFATRPDNALAFGGYRVQCRKSCLHVASIAHGVDNGQLRLVHHGGDKTEPL